MWTVVVSALTQCRRGCQETGVPAHDYVDLHTRQGTVVQVITHQSTGDELAGGAETGAMVGDEQVIVNGFRDVEGLEVVAGLHCHLVNEVAGVGRIVTADIKKVADTFYVEDLESANGIMLNQEKVTSGEIAFGDILEFDDLRIGVTNFKVTFGEDLDFDGTIFIASGGAKFLPGRPVSATLSDRITAEPDLAPGLPDTEAVRASLEFEGGEVKGFIFEVDTLRITLGSFLTLTATDLFIDTGAEADEELVSGSHGRLPEDWWRGP